MDVASRATMILFSACAVLSAGCNDSTIHAKPPEDPEIPEVELEELCGAACNIAIAPQSCSLLECGAVVTPPTENQEVHDFIVDPQTGAYCRILVECPEGSCEDAYFDCLEEEDDLWRCYDEAVECEHVNECALERAECETEEDLEYDECMTLAAGDPDAEAECIFWRDHGYCWCECQEDECLTGNDIECCGLPLMPPPPSPIQTGPARWKVSRELIDHELGRLDAVAMEVPFSPVHTPSGAVRGIRLGSLLHSETLPQLGLKQGDAILRVNGVPLPTLLESPNELLSLREADSIHVRIGRNGSARILRYDLVD